mmetsp:Transcript_18102/g.39337  ORF Transcript_18102/g.39337 Transcript_18102/m.39337 type:complete len:103 (-) Transcript_18102:3-311(-)
MNAMLCSQTLATVTQSQNPRNLPQYPSQNDGQQRVWKCQLAKGAENKQSKRPLNQSYRSSQRRSGAPWPRWWTCEENYEKLRGTTARLRNALLSLGTQQRKG